MYWLGTMIMANHLLEQLFPLVLAHFLLAPAFRDQGQSKPPMLATAVSNGAFVAAVNAVAQKYLYGQAVLATSVEEEVWMGRHAEPTVCSDHTRLLVRVLRATPQSSISISSLASLDLRMKRTLRASSNAP